MSFMVHTLIFGLVIILMVLSGEFYGTYPDLGLVIILIVLPGEPYGTYPDLWPGNLFNCTLRRALWYVP